MITLVITLRFDPMEDRGAGQEKSRSIRGGRREEKRRERPENLVVREKFSLRIKRHSERHFKSRNNLLIY